MAAIRIGQPDVLVRLPRSSSKENGALFSQVYSLTSAGKRRRQEICAAIDGDSVTVYEVHKGRTIISHVVPPDSTFPCAPLSTRIKTEEGRIERHTYCVIKRRNQQVVQLFKNDGTPKQISLAAPGILLGENVSPATQIDVLPAMKAVVVFFKNGYYQLLNINLETSISHGQLDSGHNVQNFLTFSCLSVEEASKSVLKARPDIITAVPTNSNFVCGLAKSQADGKDQATAIRFSIWSCELTSVNTLRLISVLSHELPCGPRSIMRDQDIISFSSRNTQITIRSSSRILQYDISKILPQLILDVPWSSPDQTNSIEIADNLLLCSNSSSIHLYNTKFRSVQATNDLRGSDLKRKRAGPIRGSTAFIAYFPGINRAIAARRNCLIAIDLECPQDFSLRATLQKNSTLLNNIGKGVSPAGRSRSHELSATTTLGSMFAPSADIEQWQNLVPKFDKAVVENDPITFQTLFMEHVKQSGGNDLNTSVFVSDFKISYVLSKVFQLVSSSHTTSGAASAELSVSFGTVELFQWLSLHGYLTPRKIYTAFPSLAVSERSRADVIEGISKAFISWDPSLSFLHQYLASTPLFETADLCRAVRVLLDLAMLPSVPNHSNSKHDEVAAQGQQQAPALSTLSTSQTRTDPNNLAVCLVSALRRLSNKADLKIAAILRATYKQQAIVALIQFLRQELFRSGSTRSILHQAYSTTPIPAEEPSNTLSVQEIAALLSCCIDAVGPLGIITHDSDTQFAHTIIPDLSSEITLATEAFQDALFLQGFLRETLKFFESAQASSKDFHGPVKSAPASPSQPQESGTIRTIYSQSAGNGTPLALPIGLQPEGQIKTAKIRKGSGRTSARSKREMGMLQDRLRGPYSLERLVL